MTVRVKVTLVTIAAEGKSVAVEVPTYSALYPPMVACIVALSPRRYSQCLIGLFRSGCTSTHFLHTETHDLVFGVVAAEAGSVGTPASMTAVVAAAMSVRFIPVTVRARKCDANCWPGGRVPRCRPRRKEIPVRRAAALGAPCRELQDEGKRRGGAVPGRRGCFLRRVALVGRGGDDRVEQGVVDT